MVKEESPRKNPHQINNSGTLPAYYSSADEYEEILDVIADLIKKAPFPLRGGIHSVFDRTLDSIRELSVTVDKLESARRYILVQVNKQREQIQDMQSELNLLRSELSRVKDLGDTREHRKETLQKIFEPQDDYRGLEKTIDAELVNKLNTTDIVLNLGEVSLILSSGDRGEFASFRLDQFMTNLAMILDFPDNSFDVGLDILARQDGLAGEAKPAVLGEGHPEQ